MKQNKMAVPNTDVDVIIDISISICYKRVRVFSFCIPGFDHVVRQAKLS